MYKFVCVFRISNILSIKPTFIKSFMHRKYKMEVKNCYIVNLAPAHSQFCWQDFFVRDYAQTKLEHVSKVDWNTHKERRLEMAVQTLIHRYLPSICRLPANLFTLNWNKPQQLVQQQRRTFCLTLSQFTAGICVGLHLTISILLHDSVCNRPSLHGAAWMDPSAGRCGYCWCDRLCAECPRWCRLRSTSWTRLSARTDGYLFCAATPHPMWNPEISLWVSHRREVVLVITRFDCFFTCAIWQMIVVPWRVSKQLASSTVSFYIFSVEFQVDSNNFYLPFVWLRSREWNGNGEERCRGGDTCSHQPVAVRKGLALQDPPFQARTVERSTGRGWIRSSPQERWSLMDAGAF